MLIPTYAENLFSIIVSHGNIATKDSLYFQFKRDDFMYHAARDLTGYEYKTALGAVVTLSANRRGGSPLVLTVEDSASDADKAQIERVNAEIQAYVISEVSNIVEDFHENINPEMNSMIVAA